MVEGPVTPTYIYRASMPSIERQARLDGDTWWIDLDLGLRVHAVVKIRLRNYSAPELKQPGGIKAKTRALELLYAASTLVVQTYPDQMSHDRWVGTIWLDSVPLHETLLKEGLVRHTPQ